MDASVQVSALDSVLAIAQRSASAQEEKRPPLLIVKKSNLFNKKQNEVSSKYQTPNFIHIPPIEHFKHK